jgi:hypothetical protein
VHERGDSADGQRRAEAPREAQVLEISLPCAARVCEEQAIDQSGGHDWRCPVFRKVAFTMYPITDDPEGNSMLLQQLKPKEKQ